MQWHQLDHVQTICTSLQTDSRANTPSFAFILLFTIILSSHKGCSFTHDMFPSPVLRTGGLFFAQILTLFNVNSINYIIKSTFRKKFNTRSQETVDVCLEMFGCLQAERTIAIRKRKFLKNKFSVIHNALCRVFAANGMLRQNLNHVARTFS